MTDFIEGSFTIEKPVAQKFFDALGAFVPECRLHISKAGISARAVDFANIGMVEAKLNNFMMFDYDHDTPTEIGIDINQIQNSFQMIADSDPVTISWKGAIENNLLVISSKNYELSFDLVDIHTIRKDPNPPRFPLNTSFQISGERFEIGVRFTGAIADNCYIRATPDSCIIEGKSEKSKSEYTLGSHANARARAKYSLDYLKDIAKVLKDVRIVVMMGDNSPLSVMMTDPPAPFAGLSILYLLAPRVEKE